MSKALVLSGGGPVGIAWQTGLAAGLARKGVLLADAQLILGTSAGSAVGAQLALGRDPEEQVARYEAAASRPADPPPTSEGGAPAVAPQQMARLIELLGEAAKDDGSGDMRKVVGRFALDAETFDEERFVGMFSYLAGERWPEVFRCTAVEAETGAFQVWDHQSGAAIDRAVASSCAVPGIFPPITIGGKRYMDGGVRSGASVDLAAGNERVVLVTLMSPERMAAQGADDARLIAMRERAERELDAVREAGGTVEVIGPDDEAAAVMGINLMDFSLGQPAAAAGVRQGERAADSLRDFWAS
jgi:NTE family protein